MTRRSSPDSRQDQASTIVFYLLTAFQVFHVLAIRVERNSVFTEGLFRNRYLVLAVVLTMALQILVIYAPPLQAAFRTVSLPPWDLLWITLIGSSVFFAVEFEKWLRRRRER